MTIVEQIHPGFYWAEPLRAGAKLDVKRVGKDLHITGLFPRYEVRDHPSDLIRQHEIARQNRRSQRTGKDSPHILFANANSDEKLIEFVGRFGPVVARSADVMPESTLHLINLPGKPLPPGPDRPLLTAKQDMQELRNERLIYSSAFALIMELARSEFNYLSAQRLIGEIASHIRDWPRQWKRERLQSRREPFWRLTADSLQRIQQLSSSRPDTFLPPILDARIVMCELLNVFRATAFPNPLEMHSSIKHGIRPLLYSILRREFLHPHDVGVCANTQCREFFEVERADQQFCTPECSLRQRQREYWRKTGKKRRKKRLKLKTKHN